MVIGPGVSSPYRHLVRWFCYKISAMDEEIEMLFLKGMPRRSKREHRQNHIPVLAKSGEIADAHIKNFIVKNTSRIEAEIGSNTP